MDNIRVEQIRLEDGRHAERHVKETENERVVELHCEPERPPLHLSQRLVEKTKPMVVERVVETIKDGEVIERKVESLDPQVKMELRAHIATAKTMAQQAHDDAHESDPQGVVTRDELKDAILAAVKSVRGDNAPQQQPQPHSLKVSAPQSLHALRPLKTEADIAARLDAEDKPTWTTFALFAFILLQVGALGYLVFFM